MNVLDLKNVRRQKTFTNVIVHLIHFKTKYCTILESKAL